MLTEAYNSFDCHFFCLNAEVYEKQALCVLPELEDCINTNVHLICYFHSFSILFLPVSNYAYFSFLEFCI